MNSSVRLFRALDFSHDGRLQTHEVTGFPPRGGVVRAAALVGLNEDQFERALVARRVPAEAVRQANAAIDALPDQPGFDVSGRAQKFAGGAALLVTGLVFLPVSLLLLPLFAVFQLLATLLGSRGVGIIKAPFFLFPAAASSFASAFTQATKSPTEIAKAAADFLARPELATAAP